MTSNFQFPSNTESSSGSTINSDFRLLTSDFKWIGHFLFWSIYATLDYLSNYIHYSDKVALLRDTLSFLPVLMGAAYFVANVLVPRLLWRRRRVFFIAAAALIMIVVYFLRWKWTVLTILWDDGYTINLPFSKIFKNSLRDYAVIALAVCLRIIADWDRKDRYNVQLHREKQEAELQFLRAQIHPHFLFNTLNNLYGLALRRSDQTAEGILRLSGLLDFILYDCNAPLIPLNRELEVIRKYIELERLRYGDRLDLRVDFDRADPQIPIAPLLLLPFVENCFKHGAALADGSTSIRLAVWSEGRRLMFLAENSRAPEESRHGSRSKGLGLRNVRQRLDILYPGRYALSAGEQPGTYHVILSIDY